MSRYTKYPYIQKQEKIGVDICPSCKAKKEVYRVEWRVDWFQGNCEIEHICNSCSLKLYKEDLDKAEKEREEWERHYKEMAPIWEKQAKERKAKEEELNREVEIGKKELPAIAAKYGLTLKKYDNGQWSFGDVLDWWTTTGTAIERKSRKRHGFGFANYKQIESLLGELS